MEEEFTVGRGQGTPLRGAYLATGASVGRNSVVHLKPESSPVPQSGV